MNSWDEIEHCRQISSKDEIKRLKYVRVGDKLKPWKGEILEVEEWDRLGKPEMWVLQDVFNDWHLYQDSAYGALALTQWGNQRIVVAKGNDFVCNVEHTVVGLGPYHLSDKCKIFHT